MTRVTEYADGHMTVGSMFARGYARKGGEPTPDATCFDIDRIEIVTL